MRVVVGCARELGEDGLSSQVCSHRSGTEQDSVGPQLRADDRRAERAELLEVADDRVEQEVSVGADGAAEDHHGRIDHRRHARNDVRQRPGRSVNDPQRANVPGARLVEDRTGGELATHAGLASEVDHGAGTDVGLESVALGGG